MSSISSVNSATTPIPTTNQNSFAQIVKSFQAIGSALQSGDVATAQTALTNFQQALQGNSQANSQAATSQPFGKNTQANSDYQNLTSALKSGNLSTAQQAFSSLQNDLKSAQSNNSAQATNSARRGHRHHHSSSATSATPASTTATGSAASSTLQLRRVSALTRILKLWASYCACHRHTFPPTWWEKSAGKVRVMFKKCRVTSSSDRFSP